MWLSAVMLPENVLKAIPSEIPIGVFFLLVIWGINNYFGWVRIK